MSVAGQSAVGVELFQHVLYLQAAVCTDVDEQGDDGQKLPRLSSNVSDSHFEVTGAEKQRQTKTTRTRRMRRLH